jgi:hypothetical protein
VKGQYLAVEQVMIIALGLVMATSLVAILDSYRSSLHQSDFDKSAKVIQDRVISELIGLSVMDYSTQAKIELDLREEISNQEYQVQVNNSHVTVFTDAGSDSKKHKINTSGTIQGVVDSGKVNLVKNESLIRVRS